MFLNLSFRESAYPSTSVKLAAKSETRAGSCTV